MLIRKVDRELAPKLKAYCETSIKKKCLEFLLFGFAHVFWEGRLFGPVTFAQEGKRRLAQR